jgi:hypothetical protein
MLSNKVYEILADLSGEDRAKVMNAVTSLFGETSVSPNGGAHDLLPEN